MAGKVYREDALHFGRSRLLKSGWSAWLRVMVPQDGLPHFKKRKDEPGYRLTTEKVEERLGEHGQGCGIYEWAVVDGWETQEGYVVYLGRTCREEPRALVHRILEYCRHGSDKYLLLNDSLWNGYELWVRVKRSRRRMQDTRKEQDEMLAKYDYAWNTAQNGPIRDILQ